MNSNTKTSTNLSLILKALAKDEKDAKSRLITIHIIKYGK